MKSTFTTIILQTAVLLIFSVSSFVFCENLSIDRFINPETCGDCHTDIYKQWQNSMHNFAHNDPVYIGVSLYLLKGLKDEGEIAESESCVKCHTPVGYVSGYPLKTSDDIKKVPVIAAKGIQCDYCHSAVKAEKMVNNGIVLSPGNGEANPGVKRGPYADSKSDFHETAFSAFHTGPDICGTCHNVSHVSFGTKLETTYDEWKKGPYNTNDEKTRVTCQDCHMVQRPGIPATGSTIRPKNKGVAADGSVIRDHVYTHFFVGANTIGPPAFGCPEKKDMALERLKHSAILEIDIRKIKQGRLGVVVKNTGAGHYLPTGLTDVRQMWLEIIVKNEKNQTVFSSGIVDRDGYLPEGTILYHTVFGDGKGKPVKNIAKAREILIDKRIPPKGSAREDILIGNKKSKQLNINVTLLYRSAPQDLIDSVFGKGTQSIPIITMEHAEKTINL